MKWMENMNVHVLLDTQGQAAIQVYKNYLLKTVTNFDDLTKFIVTNKF